MTEENSTTNRPDSSPDLNEIRFRGPTSETSSSSRTSPAPIPEGISSSMSLWYQLRGVTSLFRNTTGGTLTPEEDVGDDQRSNSECQDDTSSIVTLHKRDFYVANKAAVLIGSGAALLLLISCGIVGIIVYEYQRSPIQQPEDQLAQFDIPLTVVSQIEFRKTDSAIVYSSLCDEINELMTKKRFNDVEILVQELSSDDTNGDDNNIIIDNKGTVYI